MAESYFTTNRKINKERLLNFIKEHPDITLKKALGLFSQNTGLKMSTLLSYIEEMKAAELID